jgi:hypothetical protein
MTPQTATLSRAQHQEDGYSEASAVRLEVALRQGCR